MGINIKTAWRLTAKVFLSVISVVLFLVSLFGVYSAGLLEGYNLGQSDAEVEILSFLEKIPPQQTPVPSKAPQAEEQSLIATPKPQKVTPKLQPAAWGGPGLWEAVNKRRMEFGVNQLSQRDELCTIASIRLNELLDLGKLDAHEGFSNMSERRPDLKWILDRYGNIAEFLAVGGESAEETVSLWENTLGHKKLLTGGEYVWGCIYAQNTFAVAITAF